MRSEPLVATTSGTASPAPRGHRLSRPVLGCLRPRPLSAKGRRWPLALRQLPVVPHLA